MPSEKTAKSRKSGFAGVLRPTHGRLVLPRGKLANDQNPPADPANRPRRCARIYQRRKRSGQGSGGPDAAPAIFASPSSIHQGELRGSARRTSDRKSVV